MTHQHLHMATHVDNYPGEVAVLREALVVICNGNHCAAIILDYFYEKTLMLVEVKRHTERYSREEMSVAIEASPADLEKMMCGLFGESDILNAFTVLLEKGYIHDYEVWGDPDNPEAQPGHYGMIFDLDTQAVDNAVIALREPQDKKSEQSRQETTVPAPKVIDEHAIYALVDPRDNSIHYIGMSRDAQKRYRQHVTCSGTNLLKNMWIVDLLRQGLRPTLTIIETVDGLQAARDRETLWINHHLAQGAPLTNWNQNEVLRNSDGGTRIDNPGITALVQGELTNRGES